MNEVAFEVSFWSPSLRQQSSPTLLAAFGTQPPVTRAVVYQSETIKQNNTLVCNHSVGFDLKVVKQLIASTYPSCNVASLLAI